MNKSSGELDAGEKCPGDVAKKTKTKKQPTGADFQLTRRY